MTGFISHIRNYSRSNICLTLCYSYLSFLIILPTANFFKCYTPQLQILYGFYPLFLFFFSIHLSITSHSVANQIKKISKKKNILCIMILDRYFPNKNLSGFFFVFLAFYFILFHFLIYLRAFNNFFRVESLDMKVFIRQYYYNLQFTRRRF